MSISREAWLAAVGPAVPQEDDQEALTVVELADVLNCSQNTARVQADRLVKAGKAVETHKRIMRGDGRRMTSRAYRLL